MNISGGDYYFDDTNEPKLKSGSRRFAPVLAFLLLIVGGSYLVQTTLAASISLNSGSDVEFGQGVTATAACSGDTPLTVTPSVSFVNASGGGSHYLNSITVSGIPIGCYGSDFIINAYGDTGSTALAMFNTTSTDAVVYNNSGSFEAGVNSSGMSVTSGSGTFTVTFANPVATSDSVFKVTLESTSHTVVSCETGGTCTLGESGPGGGIVFYVASSPFACGPTLAASCTYLEATLTDEVGVACEAGSTFGNDSNSQNLNTNGAVNTIGAGYESTLVITGVCSAGAAAASRAIVGSGGQNDWYLPNKAELIQLYNQRNTVGGFGTSNYWASWTNTWQFRSHNFQDNYPDNSYTKGTIFHSRAIRAF